MFIEMPYRKKKDKALEKKKKTSAPLSIQETNLLVQTLEFPLCAHAMPSYKTFDWLLWIRPIESLLGVNSVPSHASGEHAWVSWHRYQPPPLFIRSPHLLPLHL